MKVLIFEYVTGGGFLGEQIPKSLAHEGRMMVNALVSNFEKLPEVEITLFKAEKNADLEFQQQIKNFDAVWIIAPEFDGILERFCRYVENENKRLLTSPAKAVALTANKFTTFRILNTANIPTIPTAIFNSVNHYDQTKEWIIKPIDGAGAENTFLLTSQNDWSALPAFEKIFLIQPHIHGEKTSLSCLFKNGEARLLCVNLQVFELENQQYVLKNIEVNYKADDGHYQKLISQIAKAFPDLFGYVGIDLIENADDCFVLEINPRLTTSFVDIEKKLGLNVAELVINEHFKTEESNL